MASDLVALEKTRTPAAHRGKGVGLAAGEALPSSTATHPCPEKSSGVFCRSGRCESGLRGVWMSVLGNDSFDGRSVRGRSLGLGDDGSMIGRLYRPTRPPRPVPRMPVGHHQPPDRDDDGMTTIEKLRTLARELAGEAWDYDRRRLSAQAHARRLAAKAVMNQADRIQDEDAMFEDPPTR